MVGVKAREPSPSAGRSRGTRPPKEGNMNRHLKLSRLSVLAALALALILGAHSGVAAAQESNARSGDLTVGTGMHVGGASDGSRPEIDITVASRSGPSGENPSGRVLVRSGEGSTYSGHVTCVTN